MKKIFAILLIFGLLSSVAVLADSGETLTMSVSGKTEGYAVGDVVTVTVTASDPARLYYLCVTPVYDKTVFSLTAENGNVFAEMGQDTNLTFDGVASPRGNTVATLKFTVLTNTVGEHAFGLTVREAYSESEAPVICTVSTASAQIGIRGDVNGDGSRQPGDLVVLMKYLSGASSAPKYPDVNNDGVHDLLDLVRLMKLMAN